MDYVALIERFKDLPMIVVGDPMVDVYHWGHVDRISPEAPVPVFVEDREEFRSGGAANVGRQLISLGCNYREYFPRPPWIEKHRYMVGSHQMFRVDKELEYCSQYVLDHESPSAIVVSDYAKGAVQIMPRQKVPIVVDPKGSDWLKYQGCTVICPNEKEYAQWDKRGDFAAILVKRGANGMDLYENNRKVLHVEAKAKAVFDVTGCGDTVVAVLAATLGASGSLDAGCQLAAHAAGYVAGEVGTAVCSAEKLKELVLA
jgi:D-beta-D-heptose 7-phosphate kinase/D-beta-D-heptose 1-phosphate adenosyltransferase